MGRSRDFKKRHKLFIDNLCELFGHDLINVPCCSRCNTINLPIDIAVNNSTSSSVLKYGVDYTIQRNHIHLTSPLLHSSQVVIQSGHSPFKAFLILKKGRKAIRWSPYYKVWM